MQITLSWQTVVGLAGGVAALIALLGYLFKGYAFVQRQKKQDGEFGQTTEKAVAAFQRDYSKNCGGNLDVDGEVGGATWAALLKFD